MAEGPYQDPEGEEEGSESELTKAGYFGSLYGLPRRLVADASLDERGDGATPVPLL